MSGHRQPLRRGQHQPPQTSKIKYPIKRSRPRRARRGAVLQPFRLGTAESAVRRRSAQDSLAASGAGELPRVLEHVDQEQVLVSTWQACTY